MKIEQAKAGMKVWIKGPKRRPARWKRAASTRDPGVILDTMNGGIVVLYESALFNWSDNPRTSSVHPSLVNGRRTVVNPFDEINWRSFVRPQPSPAGEDFPSTT